MNKKLIKTRFAKHLADYDKNAKVQKKMAEKLITLCGHKKYNNVLEIGCGTGFLTKEAVKNLKYENYKAIDIVEDCKDFIKNIDEKIEFIAEDIETYCDNLPMQDLIISNASLQWTSEFSKIVKKLESKLNAGGELIFSTFGVENFREIFYIMGQSLKYYSENELKEMFPNYVIYPQEIHVMSFKTPKDVLKHLQHTGVNAIQNEQWTKGDLKNFEDAYSSLCVKIPTLTYNPIYVKFTNQTVG